ncbi:MAG: HAD family hydrolase [Eubacterium sp.]|nr:HAD family hydrolase [Eubacterium sp.]
MSKYDTVLFDFDGTIVDSTDAVLKSWQHTYDVLRPGEYDEAECLKTFGEQLDISLHKHFPEVPTEKAVAIYRDWQIERLTDLVHEIPGVLDAVGRVHDAGFKTGVVTSRHKETADIMFDLFDARQYFDVMLTCEDTERHKPDPAPIDKALSMLASDPEKSLYIGDAVFDLLTSHNAGVDFALVLWTRTYQIERDPDGNPVKAISSITDDQPEYLIATPAEIIDVL